MKFMQGEKKGGKRERNLSDKGENCQKKEAIKRRRRRGEGGGGGLKYGPRLKAANRDGVDETAGERIKTMVK